MGESSKQVMEKAARVKFLLLDVDGVLTDGSLYYGPQGEAIKMFNVRDGSAIKWMQRAGLELGIMTGRTSPQVDARAKELGIETVIQGALRKLPLFNEFVEETKLDPKTIAFMGDDYHDLPVLKRVGLRMAPADAVPEVLAAVDWVADSKGGHGAVREACELILKAQGKWDEVTALYFE